MQQNSWPSMALVMKHVILGIYIMVYTEINEIITTGEKAMPCVCESLHY